MRRIGFIVLAISLALAPLAGESQSPVKVPRIGYLVLPPLVDPPSVERQAFLDGLRDLGYVVGRTVIIEYRSAAWNRELLSDLAAELVELKVDIIVAIPGAVEAARDATNTIPIVVPSITDPVQGGLVASLSRPGGNITGPGGTASELSEKQLELLKEAIPKLAKVAVLWNPSNQGAPLQWKGTQTAARLLGLTLQTYEVRDPNELPRALVAMTRGRPDALLVFISPLTTAYRPIIVESALKQRLPTMFGLKADVEAGGLISYSANLPAVFRRAAHYVDRILKGAKAGDLPIEQPTRLELIINLKTARALGLTIPQTLLLRADQVIE